MSTTRRRRRDLEGVVHSHGRRSPSPTSASGIVTGGLRFVALGRRRGRALPRSTAGGRPHLGQAWRRRPVAVPGCLRASARTKRNGPGRTAAAPAMPSQTDAHRMCDTGSIVWVAIVPGRGPVEDEVYSSCPRSTCSFEPQAAGAPEPERVPLPHRVELEAGRTAQHQHLVTRRAVRITPGGGQHGVGLGAVGNDRRFLAQPEPAVAPLERTDARPHVATDSGFGRRRGQEPLVPRQLARILHQVVRSAVAHEAGQLHEVHGVDHGGRRAVAAEGGDGVRSFLERRPLASEIGRHEARTTGARRASACTASPREAGIAKSDLVRHRSGHGAPDLCRPTGQGPRPHIEVHVTPPRRW